MVDSRVEANLTDILLRIPTTSVPNDISVHTASGKSTIAVALESALLQLGKNAALLDGDNVRFGLNKDLGFSQKDREENIRRIGEVGERHCVVIHYIHTTDYWPGRPCRSPNCLPASRQLL